MRHLIEKGGIVLRLDPGEEVKEAIERFCSQNGVRGGALTALGAVKDPELGCFDPTEQIYHKQVLPGFWEVGAVVGNISMLEEKPFAHLHATISGPSLEALTGHLFKAIVSVTLEAFIVPGESTWLRPVNRKGVFNALLPA